MVVHHFVGSDPLAAALPHRAWIDVAFFHNSWLFVDLFFVLSGIVISMSYVQSEFSGFDFRTFTLRRIARIYPLHIVMLFAFLAFRLMRLTLTELDLLHFSTNETADLQVNNVYSFVANVFLLHAMGVLDYLSWNGPSWSISAEFYTYLVFGAVVVLSQRLGYIKLVYVFSAVLAVMGAALIIFVLKNETLDFQTNAFTRCFLGFFVGVLTLRFVSGKGRSVSPFVQSGLPDRRSRRRHRAGFSRRLRRTAQLRGADRFRRPAGLADGVSGAAPAEVALRSSAGLAGQALLFDLHDACADTCPHPVLRAWRGHRAPANRGQHSSRTGSLAAARRLRGRRARALQPHLPLGRDAGVAVRASAFQSPRRSRCSRGGVTGMSSNSSALPRSDWRMVDPVALPRHHQQEGSAFFSLEAIALLLYFYRDALAGALRYYLAVLKISPLWFLPDIFALVCIFAFVQRYVLMGRNLVAILTLFYICFALYLGYVFLGYFSGMMSSFKMIAPVFVGFCFCGRNFGDYDRLLRWLHPIFYLTIVGIILSSRMQLPWVGYAYETFGTTRQATRLWWTASETRLAGLAADSTMAAFFVFISFVISSVRRNLLWCLFWAPIGLYAIKLTTNKTSLGVMVIYVACLIIVRLVPEREKFPMLRRMALLSFLSILVPAVLIALFSGNGLVSMSRGLFSLQDRVNNSWQLPFVYMAELMPVGFFTGCGLGCFNYPQLLFSNKLSYYVPVDNFYLGTYLMFGPIFVLFMVMVILAVARTRDIYKLSFAVAMNLFTITVLAYGPASGLIMLGVAFSEVFARERRDETVADAAPLAPDVDDLVSRPA
ncbi:hypothetical protein ABIF97_004803 [Bradyrhizobium japonicum]